MRETYEAWADDESVTFAPTARIETLKKQGLLSLTAELLHTISAESFEEAMKMRHE